MEKQFAKQDPTTANNEGDQLDNNSALRKQVRKQAHKSVSDIILANYRKTCAKQIKPSIDILNAALSMAKAAKLNDNFTETQFEQEMARRIDLLLSSSYFCEDCQVNSLEPFAAASHFVLNGWQALADYLLRKPGAGLNPTEHWSNPMFDRVKMASYVPHIDKMLTGEVIAKSACDEVAEQAA